MAYLTREHGYPPTFREVGAALEISSTNGIRDHLLALRKKGWVDWQEGKARTLRLLKDIDATVE